MTDRKFKPEQTVVIPGLLVNGERRDVEGIVQRYLYSGGEKKTLKVEVLFNEVYLLLTEDKLKSLDEYKNDK